MLVKVLIPSGALGLGFSEDALNLGLKKNPDIIAIDGGSTDSGPFYLGTGTSKYSKATTKKEWSVLMKARAEADVPLLIGTAGTCGADSAVDWLLDIAKEIAAETGQSLKICTIKCNQPAARVANALSSGDVSPLKPEVPISEELLASCTNIVALAGVEQINHALESGADIVIAGRTTDTAVIAAYPISKGCHVGAAWHGAKIGECGALCTTKPGSGVILIEFDETGFEITPMDPGAKATPRTVSAHMLYENSNPYQLYEPGGYLEVSQAKYSAVSDKTVRVEGSQWIETAPYTVKLEGATHAGYQTLSHVIIRDARYVENVDRWIDLVKADFLAKFTDFNPNTSSIEFRVMGKDAVLGHLENRNSSAPELGVMVIVTAPTQEQATEIARALNPALLHLALDADEALPTFAFPFSPAETERGPIYEFCLNHVMALNDPLEAFSFDTVEV
ncbi:MAG: acyclic terpene utilization AtuA family protein [Pseudomonadota bacterium]